MDTTVLAPAPAGAIVPRKKQRWITAVFFSLAGLIAASWSSRIPNVQQNLQLNDAVWGTVLFAMPVGLVCGLIIASWLIAHFGTKKVMVTACLISCVLLSLLGRVNSGTQLMVCLFFFGFIRTVFNISINTQAVHVQRLYDQPIVTTFHGLWSLASFVAAAIGTFFIVRDIVPSMHFLIIAVFCAACALIFGNKSKAAKEAEIEKKPLLVKPDRFLLLLGLIAFCVMLCESTMFDWGVNYFKKAVGVEKGLITTGYTTFIIAMAFGRLTGDKIVGRYGAVAMSMINSVLIAAGFALAAAFPFLITAAIGFLLIGLGDSIVVPVIYMLSAKTKKMPPSYAIAAVTLIGYAGFLTGPLLVGSVSEAIGMQWAFAVVGAISLCITFLTLLLKRYIPA